MHKRNARFSVKLNRAFAPFAAQSRRTERNFPITEQAFQKQFAIVCDYLGFEGISTHSFRKWYATEIYKANGYDIALVQRLL